MISIKKTSQWLNPLAILAVASLGWTAPSVANEAYPTAAVDYFQGKDSIPLQVEPPAPSTIPLPAIPSDRPPLPRDNFGNFGSPIYQGTCAANLDSVVRRIVGANYGSRWGILVEKLDTGEVLFSHNGDRGFIPASNQKIFTTAAALQRLNANTPIRSNSSLQDWVMVINKRSHNGYADSLMRYLGGPGAAKATLAQLGVDPGAFRIADGSGLSRSNTTTPRALVDTLRAMYYSPQGQLFVASLPVAGQNGTLTRRMRATPAQGNVYAKTGTLRGVRALSGYANNPTHGTLVFSILANDFSRSGDSLVRAIDQVVVQLNTMGDCR